MMTPREAVEMFARVSGNYRPPCPECKTGRLSLVEATVVEQYHPGYYTIGTKLPTRERETLAIACNECEFMTELREFRSC